MRAHHLPEPPGYGFVGRLAVDRGGALQQPPARRLRGRVGDCAGRRAKQVPRRARLASASSRKPAVEIVPLEADQRLLPALDHGKDAAAALHFGDGEQRRRLDAELRRDVFDFVAVFSVNMDLAPLSAASLAAFCLAWRKSRHNLSAQLTAPSPVPAKPLEILAVSPRP